MKNKLIALLFTLLLYGRASAQDFVDLGYSGVTQVAQWEFFSYQNTMAGLGNPPQLAEGSPNADILQYSLAVMTSAGNIISPFTPLDVELTAESSNALQRINLQLFTFGDGGLSNETVRLVVDGGAVLTPESSTNFSSTYDPGDGGYGGYRNGYSVEWDLSGLTITNYSLHFMVSQFTSLDRIQLNTQAAMALPEAPVLEITYASSKPVIGMQSESNVICQLYCSGSLTNAPADWIPIGNPISGTGHMIWITNKTAESIGFYQAKVWFSE